MNILSEIVGNDHTGLRSEDCHNYNGNIENVKKGECYFSSPFLSFGDYDNSCDVERSNVRVFLELFKNHPDVKTWRGGYGSKAILIDVLCEDQEIIETLQALENYPVMDESDLCELRMEMEEEEWTGWIERDFKEAIEKRYKADASDPNEEELKKLYFELQDQTSTYFEVESGGNGYINIKRLVSGMPDIAPEFLKLEYWNI